MKRTCWVWCPQCRHDLNGDNESFVDDVKGVVTYRCSSCGLQSQFLFDTPVPVLVS